MKFIRTVHQCWRFYFCMNEFRCGQTSTPDEAQIRCHLEVTTQDIMVEIKETVMQARWITVREIADTLGISTERGHKIFHKKLQLKKSRVQWVPRLFTVEQKRTWKDTSAQCLPMLSSNPQDILHWCVSVTETWIHYYILDTKQQPKQWLAPGEGTPMKAKTIFTAEKAMATAFFF